VTAEIAVGVIGLLALVLGLVWAVLVGATQVRLVDAAGEAARAAARGEPPAVVRAVAAAATTPQPIQVRISHGHVHGNEVVRVAVSARVTAPGSWAVPSITLRATGTAPMEPEGSGPLRLLIAGALVRTA
jgi:hypothetical protein